MNDAKTVSSGSVNPFKEEATPTEKKKQAPPPTLDSDTGAFVRRMAADMASSEFDLPPFPDTALRIQECIRDENADSAALAAIVAQEPALAAKLMRMANSAMLRRGPIKVTDIPTAISRVGLDMVQNVAMTFAARDTFKVAPGSIGLKDIERLREASIRVGAIGYVLTRECPSSLKPDEAMLAGLLSAVGKLYIFTQASDYPALFSERDALDRLVHQWHTGVARAIVEAWNFPPSIAVAVDEQEIRDRSRSGAPDLSDILFIANLLARAGLGAAEHLGDLAALDRLNLDAEDLADIIDENEAAIESLIASMH
jgi:HD-like signal output (HDOD) protein